MKKGKRLLVFLIVLVITVSCLDSPKVGKYFARPTVNEYIADGRGFMTNGGDFIPSENAVCVPPTQIMDLKKYYSDKEKRLYICLKYPRKCK